MKRRITIKIEAGAKTCQACRWLDVFGRYCTLHHKTTEKQANSTARYRLPECLDAEAKARGQKP